MIDIVELAQGVAKEVGNGAVISLAPDYTLRDVKEALRIVVVPVGIDHRMLSRSHREDTFKIQIGVLRKATEDELQDLIRYVQNVARDFFRKKIRGCVCISAHHEPLFVPDHLKERRQFTSVIELTFKEVENQW